MPLAETKLSPVLVLAVSGRIGSGATFVSDKLKSCLDMFGYATEIIKVSDLLKEPPGQLATLPGLPPITGTRRPELMRSLQDRGDFYRKHHGIDILAGLCLHRIAELLMENGQIRLDQRRAFIIDSLKHPGETRLFRQICGEAFLLIGVVASDLTRRDRLVQQKGFINEEFDELSLRDADDEPKEGQHAIKTVVESDYFFANDYPKKADLLKEASRLVELIFRVGMQTPTRDEVGMQMAAEAASRSACLSRQVGAALYSSDGMVLATGHNDVPQFGGGLYGSKPDVDDRRCYAWGARCYNDKNKNEIIEQLWSLIETTVNDHQETIADNTDLDELKNKLNYAIRSSSKIRSLTEFSRAIHAEMDAIISVARKSIRGLVGSTLYCTTFPCHNCAKHIIGSGIHRVVYLEPYEKSLARELHSDAINDPNSGKQPNKVTFDLYGGVSPYRFDAFFRMREDRKPRDGSGLFLDHDRERHVRLPFMAQELPLLEKRLMDFYRNLSELASDTTQMRLPLRQ